MYAVSFNIFATSLFLMPGISVGQENSQLHDLYFGSEEFTDRRDYVYDAIGPNAVAVVQGASGSHSSTRFRQSNQFYYLTGVETPNAYLVIDGRIKRSTLYLPPRNTGREATDGPVLNSTDPVRAVRLTGVDAVSDVNRLAEDVFRRVPSGMVLYTPMQPAEGHSESRAGILRAKADMASDPWRGRPTVEGHFVNLLQSRFPFIEVRDLSPILDDLRLIKSASELAVIRRATELSGEALLEAMRSTAPGVKEKELYGLAHFIFVRHGAQGEAYRAIVASGPNAWFAHHRAAGREMEDGDLVLMDYCPDLGYYRCDVTRMWPVNGQFNDWQRELYGFYLEFYEAILYAIRPGITPQEVKQEALQEIDEILSRTEFSKPEYRRAAVDFVESYRRGSENPETRMGHWVGMSTHDPGTDSGPLRPGMVFVIEPQFRVPEEEIYIRLEDMIVITDDGAEIISDWVPRDMDGIEQIMAQRGLLQSYPRIQSGSAGTSRP